MSSIKLCAIAGLAAASAAAAAPALESLELRLGGRTNGIAEGEIRHHTESVRKINDNASYEASLVGFIYYNSKWENISGNTPFGMYTFSTRPGSQYEEFAQIGLATSYTSGGAVLAGDIMWYIWRQQAKDETQNVDISQLYSYDINTREFTRHGEVPSELSSKNDHAWDPTTGIIYGTYDINGTRTLCTVDYREKKRTSIASCDEYYGLACDGKGVLYGVNAVGDLSIIDTRTAHPTRVGNTGIIPAYAQSMVYDVQANVIWWAALTDNGSGIYRIDPATAKTTKVTEFDGKVEVMGLGVIPSRYSDDVPGYATDLKIETTGTSTDAKFSFTLPGYDFIGNPLEGNVSYKMLANGNNVAEGEGTPASKVNGTLTLPEGSVQIKLICSNDKGEGPAAISQHWVGPGFPVEPEGVNLDINAAGGVTLTWDPVTEGYDGGYINPADITYKIIAYPGAREAAAGLKECKFSETIEEPERPTQVYYEVIACNDWRESEAAKSNSVTFGKGLPLPYRNDFNSADALSLFTVIDGNKDGKTWELSDYADSQQAYIFTGTMKHDHQDDWLITPGLQMKAGGRYRLSFYTDITLGGARFTDMLEIGFGKGQDPETYEIVKEPFRTDPTSRNCIEVEVEVKEDGYYHFGFHCISDTDISLQVNVDNLLVEALASKNAPAAVSGLEFKTTNGAAPIRFSFTTPTKTAAGDDLDKITKVELWRDDETLVASKEMTETGKKTILVDENGANGWHTYSVVAYNEVGMGERADAKVFLGIEKPDGASNITLKDNHDGSLTLSWDAPTTGANGGFCDPEHIVYNVYTVEDGHAVDFKQGITETSVKIYVDDDSYYGDSQGLVLLAVAAENSEGESKIRVSNEVVVGKPYQLPYKESWVQGVASSFWTYANSGKYGWEPSRGTVAYDGDNGFMAFQAAADGDMSYLYLGKVDIRNAEAPALIFNYYATPGCDAFIQPEINKAYKDGWVTTPGIDFMNLDGQPEWKEAVIRLDEFKKYPYITVRFLGKTLASIPLFIDNVRVENNFAGVGQIATDAAETMEHYDMFGLRVTNLVKGNVYIVRKSDGTSSKIVY